MKLFIDHHLLFLYLKILLKILIIEIKEYSTFYNDYKKNKDELENLKSKNISSEYYTI